METSIGEDFGAAGMWGYREDLIARLNHVLAQLDWGSRPLGQNKPMIGEDTVYRMGKYHMKLRDALRGAGVETIGTLASVFLKFNDRS